MAAHALRPVGKGHAAMLAGGIMHGVIEDRAGSLLVGHKAAEHIANLARRPQMNGAEFRTGEQARHFLHCDPVITAVRRTHGMERLDQAGAATDPLPVVARFAGEAAGVAGNHRRTVVDRLQHIRAVSLIACRGAVATGRPRAVSTRYSISSPARIAPLRTNCSPITPGDRAVTAPPRPNDATKIAALNAMNPTA